jgi:hypothetical protein
MKTTKRIICTKDLVMDSGERSFTKGNELARLQKKFIPSDAMLADVRKS